jgi:hypothetical protein
VESTSSPDSSDLWKRNEDNVLLWKVGGRIHVVKKRDHISLLILGPLVDGGRTAA